MDYNVTKGIRDLSLSDNSYWIYCCHAMAFLRKVNCGMKRFITSGSLTMVQNF